MIDLSRRPTRQDRLKPFWPALYIEAQLQQPFRPSPRRHGAECDPQKHHCPFGYRQTSQELSLHRLLQRTLSPPYFFLGSNYDLQYYLRIMKATAAQVERSM